MGPWVIKVGNTILSYPISMLPTEVMGVHARAYTLNFFMTTEKVK